MKVLIVHAHPEPKSFCSAMFHRARQTLADQGHTVQTSDLYAMGFNPLASQSDFKQMHDPDYLVYALEQRQAHQSGILADDIQSELDKLLWCDLLVLNFPVFWCSTPAMLKGWIDRVMISGVTYGGKRFYDKGGLVGKQALVSATIGGQAHMFEENGVHGPLEDMLRHLLRGTLAYTGMMVLPPFVAWHVPYITDEARQGILDQYQSYLQKLAELPPLKFPSLNDFDNRSRPLATVSDL